VISKTPGFEPSNYAEAGVNSYGNRYLSFDFTGPAATPSGPSNELYYRLLGTVKGGDTQTDFTPDNTYFVAPSVTYKPEADTTLTILASPRRTRRGSKASCPMSAPWSTRRSAVSLLNYLPATPASIRSRASRK
jgi:iron complex outermembrane recepter protein